MSIYTFNFTLISSLFIIFSPLNSSAYLLSSNTVLKKTAQTHGKKGYKIIQEVTFPSSGPSSGDDLKVIEEWTIQDGERMHLVIKTPSTENNSRQNDIDQNTDQLITAFTSEFLYANNKKYYRNDENELFARPLTNTFLEKYFHYRSGVSLKSSLLRDGIIPRLEIENSIPEENDRLKRKFPYKPEPFVRLSRLRGTTVYALGSLSSPSSINPFPGIWLEQDNFYIRKIRLPSQEELFADDYQEFSSLWFPKTRSLKWNNQKITFRTISVTQINIGPKTKRLLKKESLKSNNSFLNPTVNEFYSRFR